MRLIMMNDLTPPCGRSGRPSSSTPGILARVISGGLRGLAAGLVVGAAPPQQARAATKTLDVLVQVDALGYQCIPEEQLEAAFASSGKGAYLPRTCMKDPCAAEPEESLLAELLGRKPTEDEIDEFRQRHIVGCTARGPKFPPGYEPYLPILTSTPHSERPTHRPGPVPPGIFNTFVPPAPIVPPTPVVFETTLPPVAGIVRPVLPPETTRTPATVFGGVPPGSEGGTPLTLPPTELPIIATSPPTPLTSTPTPVPLPQTLALLLGALLGAVGLRRSKRN